MYFFKSHKKQRFINNTKSVALSKTNKYYEGFGHYF